MLLQTNQVNSIITGYASYQRYHADQLLQRSHQGLLNIRAIVAGNGLGTISSLRKFQTNVNCLRLRSFFARFWEPSPTLTRRGRTGPSGRSFDNNYLKILETDFKGDV